MSFFNRKKTISDEDKLKVTMNGGITVNKIKEIQHRSKEYDVTKLIEETNHTLVNSAYHDSEQNYVYIEVPISSASVEMVNFVHYYVSRGFSVSFADSWKILKISWEELELQEPSTPRFITKGLEQSLCYYVKGAYPLDCQIALDLYGIYFNGNELECTAIHSEASELLTTKRSPKDKYFTCAWEQLCNVKNFLLEYDKQYGTEKGK